MSRPEGPKKIAAREQLTAMRAQGLKDDEIRQALVVSGLSRAQVLELMPVPIVEPVKPVITDDAKAAVIGGAVHFLESIAKRITPDMVDRFADLGAVKSDALTWGRKVKGAL